MYLVPELLKRDVPCWYRISNTSEKLLTILVHREIVDTLMVPTEESPMIHDFREMLGLEDKFFGGFQEQFGFGGIIKVEEKESDPFLHLEVPLPLFRVETQKPCEFCGGSGMIYFPLFKESYPCGHCEDAEKEHHFDWKAAYQVSASLCVLFQLLSSLKEETSARIPQLLTVETIVKPGLHGSSLGGRYSKTLVQWMTNLGVRVSIPEMERAMFNAYKYMNGGKFGHIGEHEFRANVYYKNGWLNVSIPGNACDLNPEYGGPGPDRGYKYDSHNVDSPVQQLTLLAGLAALSDRCLQEM